MSRQKESFSSNSITSRISPIKLAIVLLVATAVISLFNILSHEGEEANYFPFLISSSACLLYAVFTSVSLVTIRDIKSHWNQAILGYILLLILGIGIATVLSGQNVVNAASYYTIYSVVTIGYLVFLSIMRGVRFVIDFSQRPNLK